MSDRRVEHVTVPESEAFRRDIGKMFKITEWGARRAETWANGIVFALKGSNGEIPMDVARLGAIGVMISLANVVLKAEIEYAKVQPFYDQLLECVQVVLDPNNVDRSTGRPVATPLLDDSISEVSTLHWLRSEVFRVHTNFSVADGLSGLLAMMRAAKPNSEPSTTPTSPPSSDA